jgi:surface antigen
MRRTRGAERRLVAPAVIVAWLAACAGNFSISEAKDLDQPDVSGNPQATPLYQGLGEAEIARARAAIQNALERTPSRQTGHWQSELTGLRGSVTPLRTFRTTEGLFCREFRETISASALERSAVRLACRTTDGLWRPAQSVPRS